LRNAAHRSLKHTRRQAKAVAHLSKYGHAIVRQSILRGEIHLNLINEGKRAMKLWDRKITCRAYLVSKGSNAVAFMTSKYSAFQWLQEQSVQAFKKIDLYNDTVVYLRELGRKTLKLLNQRSIAVDYLITRRINSQSLIKRKNECFQYLKRIPISVWRVEDKIQNAFEWLCDVASYALNHVNFQLKAQRQLQVRVLYVTTSAVSIFLSYSVRRYKG
jgi:hypothetical protein